MRKSLLNCFLIFPLLGIQTIYGQYIDSLSIYKNDGVDTLSAGSINWSSEPVKKVFPYKILLAPSVMIAYGVTGLKSHALKSWNEEIKDEVWTEHAHGRLHIDNFLPWAPVAAVYGLNLAGIKGKNNFKDRSIIFGMSTVIMTAAVFSVKKISHEMRPDGSDSYSFPSGHTASAFAAAEFMRQEYKGVSPWYGVAGYAAAAATGYLRLYNNKHWLSDVVAGAGVGILSTDLAYYLYPSIKRIFSKKSDLSTIVLPSYQNKTVSIGLVHTFK